MVLFVSSGRDLQLSLERFADEHEVAGMRINTSNHGPQPEKGRMPSPGLGMRSSPSGGVQVSRGLVHEFKRRMERQIDRRIGAASAVMSW